MDNFSNMYSIESFLIELSKDKKLFIAKMDVLDRTILTHIEVDLSATCGLAYTRFSNPEYVEARHIAFKNVFVPAAKLCISGEFVKHQTKPALLLIN